MIDLAAFCSTDPQRPQIALPFHRDGRTFATNGHILIHVPKMDGVETGKGVDPSRVLKACSFNGLRRPEAGRLPALRYRIEADDFLDANLRVLLAMSGDIDGVPFDLFYIHQMFSLEGLRIGQPGNVSSPLPFAADGDLYGALMPLSAPSPIHFPNLVRVSR